MTEEKQHRSHIIANLIAARSFVERGWTQCAEARDSEGNPIDPDDPDAVCWCLDGAITAANGQDLMFHYLEEALNQDEAVVAAIANANQCGFSWWNDTEGRTQTEVLALFDRAIELATPEAGE